MKLNHKKLLISQDKTILEALEILNNLKNISRLILFVHNKNMSIIGSLTDGDIRRSLVKNKNVHLPVGKICFKNFSFEYDSNNYLNLEKYRSQNIVILPILNADKTIVRILDLEKTKSVLPVECVIMAGGRGKRLSPLTDKIPKPMLMLGGKPIIEHNIDLLISYGIKKIHITINYLGSKIKEYFGDGSSKGIEIKYIKEEKFLGTAGSLSLIKKFSSKEIILMNSDLFTNINLENLYKKLILNNLDMVIASKGYKVDIPYAIFKTGTKNKIISFEEKPTYNYSSNAGIYIFKKELVSLIPKNIFYDITDLINNALKTNKNISHEPIKGFWIDIGSPHDYKKAQDRVN